MTNIRKRKLLIFVLVAGMLSGCATGYKPKNSGWNGLGYTDEKISDGVYRITYLDNLNVSFFQVIDYWHQRAKELCGSSDYEDDAKISSKSYRDYNPAIFAMQTHYLHYVEGTAKCKTK